MKHLWSLPKPTDLESVLKQDCQAICIHMKFGEARFYSISTFSAHIPFQYIHLVQKHNKSIVYSQLTALRKKLAKEKFIPFSFRLDLYDIRIIG